MKKLSILTLVVLTLFSCSKNNNTNNNAVIVGGNAGNAGSTGGGGGGGNTTNNVLSYKVDGRSITAISAAGIVIDPNTGPDSTLSISSASANNENLYLWVNSETIPGTYTLKEFTDYSIDYTENGEFYSSSVTPSEITITKHDKVNQRIEGTFYGRSVHDWNADTVDITDGVFKITYVYQ